MSRWACLGSSDAENLGGSHCVVDEDVCGIEGACQWCAARRGCIFNAEA